MEEHRHVEETSHDASCGINSHCRILRSSTMDMQMKVGTYQVLLVLANLN